ncbi:MAG: hypothetical protein H6633_09220 [Anaerolineales bacterium]|nr:hypothetical protein [Anaerolineales bacterium]
MLEHAYERGFRPQCVCFDSWYAGLENLKRVSRLTAWSIPTEAVISRWLLSCSRRPAPSSI